MLKSTRVKILKTSNFINSVAYWHKWDCLND